jgi:hypothetical protein
MKEMRPVRLITSACAILAMLMIGCANKNVKNVEETIIGKWQLVDYEIPAMNRYITDSITVDTEVLMDSAMNEETKMFDTVYEFKADGICEQSSEFAGSLIEKWMLIDDGKTLVIGFDTKYPDTLHIVTLTKDSLVLEGDYSVKSIYKSVRE